MASSESSGLEGDLQRQRLEKEVRRLRQRVKDQKKLIIRMDAEAGQRFEMLDEDTL